MVGAVCNVQALEAVQAQDTHVLKVETVYLIFMQFNMLSMWADTQEFHVMRTAPVEFSAVGHLIWN